MRSNLTDIEVEIHHETDKAVLVSKDGDREKAVWLPKSACEFEKALHLPSRIVILTAPEPLLIDKGLV